MPIIFCLCRVPICRTLDDARRDLKTLASSLRERGCCFNELLLFSLCPASWVDIDAQPLSPNHFISLLKSSRRLSCSSFSQFFFKEAGFFNGIQMLPLFVGKRLHFCFVVFQIIIKTAKKAVVIYL